MPAKFTNNASATLASAITTSSTVISVTAGQGAFFPTLAGADYFFATLSDSSNNLEVVKCTARSGDSLTVTRAQDGTTARAYAAGDRIELRINAAAIDSKFDKEGGTVTGNLSVNGNTTLGDAAGDSLTVNAATISYANNPTISGAHSYSGNVSYNGNVTFGDAVGDSITINAGTVSTPNNLNFDSNTFVIDATNNRIGIGTASPTYSLSVENATSAYASFKVGVNSPLVVGQDSNGDTYVQNNANATLRFGANGAERFRVGPAGQLGIGGANYGTSGQFLRSNGSASAASWGDVVTAPNLRVITASGSFTVPAATLRVTCVGAGGGGAGGFTAGTNGGGGGGGGSSIAIVEGLTVGSTVTVTIGSAGTAGTTSTNGGAGGTTSFGSYVSATGGGGGTTTGGAGGAGGTVSSANVTYFFNAEGADGAYGVGGNGGSSMFGGAGVGARAAQGAGSSGNLYGGGGGGGGGATSTKTAGGAGAAGAAGVVIVEW